MQAAATTSSEVTGTSATVLVEEHGGLTEVARKADLTVPGLWMVLNNRRNPSYATRLKLARVFRCRIDEMAFPADLEQS